MKATFFFFALTVLLAFACGPRALEDGGVLVDDDAGFDAGRLFPDAGPLDAGFTTVAIADWCRLQSEAQCLRAVRCTRLDSAAMKACVLRAELECDSASLVSSVEHGRQTFDNVRAAACLNAYASGACQGVPERCTDLFHGTVAPDAGCALDEECDKAQGFCDPYSTQCPRRCLGWLKPSEPCSDFRTRCNPATDTCQLNDAGASVCRPYKIALETCLSFSDCRADLLCVNAVCVTYRASEGQACSVMNGYPYCDDATFCRQGPAVNGVFPPGTCERKPGLGGACLGYSSCLPALRCSSVLATGVCQPLGKLGETCGGTGTCQDELYCGSGRCAPLPTDGGDCTAQGSSYTCAAGYTCDFSAPGGHYGCSRLRAVGESCRYASDCLSNECAYQAGADSGAGYFCTLPCSHSADGGF
ncbi:MAG: hypothetical protein K1X64_07230 [Myxococcaceae bacterium]|nr:hypothetical protein [Myxococcaceae bacterium]